MSDYEACDDGNESNGTAASMIVLARCGDGFVRNDLMPGEVGCELR